MRVAKPHEARAADAGDPALEVRDLSVSYGHGTRALSGVDLLVRRGRVVALLGANGAGKTTFVRAVTGGLSHYNGSSSGSVVAYGQPAVARSATMVRRGISHVMEGRHVFADLTVRDNLRSGGHTCRSKAVLAERYEQVLTRFPSLKRRQQTLAGYLSGGEQQMLAIGRALMQEPKLLLLDEPSLGLAPTVVNQVRDLIIELNESGTTILLIEQNVAMALEISHHAYVLERGRVVRDGASAELAGDDAIRRAYLGVAEVSS